MTAPGALRLGVVSRVTDLPFASDEVGERLPTENGVAALVEGLRALGAERSLASTMALITRSAAAGLEGACDAALTVTTPRGLMRTEAPTSDLAGAVGAVQRDRGGPALETMNGNRSVVRVDDLREDDRWPAFAAEATARTPILSMLSYRLYVGAEHTVAALDVYASKPHAFTPEVAHAGEQFAAYAAAVLAHARAEDKAANLQQALTSDRDLGGATGILMTRYFLTREQSFDRLLLTSQHRHRKLRDLAEEVIVTGDLQQS